MFINKAGVKFKAFLYLFVGRFKLFGVVIVILSVYCNHKRTNKRKFCFTKILFHFIRPVCFDEKYDELSFVK